MFGLRKKTNKAKGFWPNRMEVLHAIVLDSMQGDQDKSSFKDYSVSNLLEILKGRKVFDRDGFWGQSRTLEAIVDSLGESGDLEGLPGKRFRITAKAFKSLADFEVESRRYDQTFCLSIILAVLTAVIAIGTVAPLFSNCK